MSLAEFQARKASINPLDVLLLAEVYGDKALEAAANGRWDGFIQYAIPAIHHAWSFTRIDDSFEETWARGESVYE